MTKKSKEPTSHVRSIKKFLMWSGFISEATPTMKKSSLINDFISGHCMEIPNQISRKYDKLRHNVGMANFLTLNIFTVLKVCWMTALAAVIVSIKLQVTVSFIVKAINLVHERAHLLRNYTLLVAIFVTLTTVLVKLAVSSPMKLSVCNEQSKVQTVN